MQLQNGVRDHAQSQKWTGNTLMKRSAFASVSRGRGTTPNTEALFTRTDTEIRLVKSFNIVSMVMGSNLDRMGLESI